MRNNCQSSFSVISFLVLCALPFLTYSQVQLSLNENTFGPSPRLAAAIDQEIPAIFRYTRHEGEDLGAAIVKYEGVDSVQIISGTVLAALGIYLGVKGGKGSEFIYAVPGYPALVDATATVGGVVIPIPLVS